MLPIGLGVLIVLLVAVLFFRALRFTPEKVPEVEPDQISLGISLPLERFQKMIQIPTISFADPSLEEDEQFIAFQELLVESYPNIHRRCKRERIGRRGLLYHLQGKNPGNPSVFMSHYDVVPADAEDWTYPPFSGHIEAGELWGRGTLDTKGTLSAIMEAMEYLLANDFIPDRDVYLSFSGDEEVHGSSCPSIVDTFREKGITPEFVLDEGGGVIDSLFPGIDNRLAVVGIGEKGMMDIELSIKSAGGHASSPKPQGNVYRLAKAIMKIERHPFPMRLAPPVKLLFDTIGRYAKFPYKLFYANFDFFKPVIDLLTRKSGGELNAMVRTTTAFTKLGGSQAFNVIPPLATAGINIRFLNEKNEESIVDHLKRSIDDSAIEVNIVHSTGSCPYSNTNTPGYDRMRDAIKNTWGTDVVVSPFLMLAGSDSRHYSHISEHVYRFSAMEFTLDDRKRIHGVDERIRIDEWKKTVEFYIRLIRG